ncbi:hypothetical protein, partial [Glaesserella parasuis]|uniref:hypothetical protein n=1 Tax=Glaesserella parasuis TaxID=738 RepID=UPI003F379F72
DEVTLASDLTYVPAMAVDSENVYFSTGWCAPVTSPDFMLIRSVPIGGGPLRTIYAGTRGAVSIVSTGNDVYWTTERPALLMKTSRAGGAAQT